MRISDWSSDVCSSDLIFADVRNSHTIAREEIFGPVLSVIRYESDDDAIRIANESEYGLGGTIRSEERRVGKECVVRVDLGGRRIIKKKKKETQITKQE